MPNASSMSRIGGDDSCRNVGDFLHVKNNTCWPTAVCCLLLCTATLLPGKNFPVTKATDSGSGTLRQAILDANTNADLDTITFSLTGGSAVKTITLTSPLPKIVN